MTGEIIFYLAEGLAIVAAAKLTAHLLSRWRGGFTQFVGRCCQEAYGDIIEPPEDAKRVAANLGGGKRPATGDNPRVRTGEAIAQHHERGSTR